MALVPSSIGIAVSGPVVYLKIAGKADFTLSVGFKKIFSELVDRGYRQFMIELSDCVIMDSTFLGGLAASARRLSNIGGESIQRIRLTNANERVFNILDNLGILPMFQLAQTKAENLPAFKPVNGVNPTTDKAELVRNSLEAHQILMEINPDNIPKFKDVAEFLKDDLARLESLDKK